eukprot:1863565-Amphidinium_carterae.4
MEAASLVQCLVGQDIFKIVAINQVESYCPHTWASSVLWKRSVAPCDSRMGQKSSRVLTTPLLLFEQAKRLPAHCLLEELILQSHSP